MYAFIDYNNEKDAEEAKKELNGKEICGRKINVDWSKKSDKFDSSNRGNA